MDGALLSLQYDLSSLWGNKCSSFKYADRWKLIDSQHFFEFFDLLFFWWISQPRYIFQQFFKILFILILRREYDLHSFAFLVPNFVALMQDW